MILRSRYGRFTRALHRDTRHARQCREAETTLEDTNKTAAAAVLGGQHPTTKDIELDFQQRAKLHARETPPPGT